MSKNVANAFIYAHKHRVILVTEKARQGLARPGMARDGVARHGMTSDCMTRDGMAWHGAAWQGLVGYGMSGHGIRQSMIRHPAAFSRTLFSFFLLLSNNVGCTSKGQTIQNTSAR